MTDIGVARVMRLATTPVKGLGLHHPDAIELTKQGAVGDRSFFVVDDQDRLFSIHHSGSLACLHATYDPGTGWLAIRNPQGEEWCAEVRLGSPVLADFYGVRSVAGRLVEGPWSAIFSELAGRPLRLVRTDRPDDGCDLHPATLLGAQSIRALACHARLPSVDGRRFRMLIEFEGLEPWVEDTWLGCRLVIGTAELRGGHPVLRCAATTRNPDTGVRDAPIVRLVRDLRGTVDTPQGRGVPFGIFATVERAGVVRCGDELVVT